MHSRSPHPPGLFLAVGIVAALLLTGCSGLHGLSREVLNRTDQPLAATLPPPPPPPPSPAHLAPLVPAALPLYGPPVPVPLEFRMPSQGVDAGVLAVGRTRADLIDAPEGPASDPIWTKAFWFRGGATPGDPGVTTIIGHVDDTLARPDPFARIKYLRVGDIVEVVDQRIGGIIHYRVTSTQVVWNSGLFGNAQLGGLFGLGAITQKPADKAADAASGVAKLTMMTCTGQWRNGGFDRRYFVFAVRDESVPPNS